jgi:hypothetical protein
MWHVYSVDVDFAEEGHRVVNGGWKPDLGGLVDLALVTSLNIPLHVGVKHGPPEAVKKGVARGVETLVAELVVSIMNEHISNGRAGVKLVSAAGLLLPKVSSCDEKMVHSANETGQHVSR